MTTKFYTRPLMESLFYQLVFGKYPGNDVCGIWGMENKQFAKTLLPSFLCKYSPSLPSSMSPSLSPPSQSHQGAPPRCMFMYLYVCVSKCGVPKLQGTTLHNTVKTLLIVLYFIAITQVSLPELTAACSAQICRIKLSSGPC